MRIFANANFRFVHHRKIYFTFSVLFILAGLVSLVAKGGPKYGIDFKGGTLLQVKFQAMPEISDLRDVFNKYRDIGTVEIKRYGQKEDNEIIIGVETKIEAASVVVKVTEILNAEFPGNFEIRREEVVGPRIGNELKWKALFSIMLSWVAIIIYLWVRFQLKFSLAAIVGLIHDILIVFGACSIFNIELSMPVVAAFLTIVGYSLNDTIVVFDRIRENLFVEQRMHILDLFNRSINQTLGRTIITSCTTLVAVTTLYFIGVSSIRDFAFAMIIGVIIGTYSSFGISASLVAVWNPETLRKAKKA